MRKDKMDGNVIIETDWKLSDALIKNAVAGGRTRAMGPISVTKRESPECTKRFHAESEEDVISDFISALSRRGLISSWIFPPPFSVGNKNKYKYTP